MKTLVMISLLSGILLATIYMNSAPQDTVEAQFQEFLTTYGVSYNDAYEYDFRLGVFEENLSVIEELNARDNGATFGINFFADKTEAERQDYMGYRPVKAAKDVPLEHYDTSVLKDSSWDTLWPNVKVQGDCGSCWAFSAIAALEGRWAIAQDFGQVKQLFSEQQLIDWDDASKGCEGGDMALAYKYYTEGGEYRPGICIETEYWYQARQGECIEYMCPLYDRPYLLGEGYKRITSPTMNDRSEKIVLKALESGPVAIAVDATTWAFYKKGILKDKDCGTNLNHGVTLVAYHIRSGSEEDPSFITIRNSWGPGWGYSGYIDIAVDGNEYCGWDYDAIIPDF